MNTLLSNFFSICDAPRAWGVYFQDSASPQMEALVELHDNIMFYLVIILFGVSWILVSIIRNYVSSRSPISNKYLNHGTLIELIWTITPALILILIAFPSFKLLYLMDEVTDPSLTVFVEGHQWYWSYQYPDFLNEDDGELELEFEIEFDYYLAPGVFDKFILKEQLIQGSSSSTSPLTDKSSLVLYSDISNLNNWVNLDKLDPEVKTFKQYLGSVKIASTLYRKLVNTHSDFQDGTLQVNIREDVMEKRLARSKANLLRRYEELLEKQVRILNRNPHGYIPNPNGLFDWSHEDFYSRWDQNNERNN